MPGPEEFLSALLFALISLILILLNAFFVLAEFSMVKVRPTQVAAGASRGNKTALRIQKILDNLDEYLSVCQVGITLSSIGLGFVGEPGFAALLHPLLAWTGSFSEVLTEALALGLGFLLVSYLHIVLGELVPKSVAIRETESSMALIAWPITVFRYLFLPPIAILNGSVNLFLRPFGLDHKANDAAHNEEEIRVILGDSASRGLMSFRRLLYLENVLDLGALTVRNGMCVLRHVKTLPLKGDREEIFKILKQYRYSRYPVISPDAGGPLGFLHVKDLALEEIVHPEGRGMNFEPLLRPALKAKESDPLEKVLGTMQRSGGHMAFVYDGDDRWTGIITLEDILEEVVGTIEEEYPVEPPVSLSQFLHPEMVFLDIPGRSVEEAIRNTLKQVPAAQLPGPAKTILDKIMEREGQGGTFVGRHLSIPHGRLEVLRDPVVIVSRLKDPVTVSPLGPPKSGYDSVRMLFILLTPANTPRIHQILLSHIASIYESGFLETRLYEAKTSKELYEVITTAEQVSIG